MTLRWNTVFKYFLISVFTLSNSLGYAAEPNLKDIYFNPFASPVTAEDAMASLLTDRLESAELSLLAKSPQFQPQANESIIQDQQKIWKLAEMAGLAQEAIGNWEEGSLKVLSEVEILYRGLISRWADLQNEHRNLSVEEFQKEVIDKNQVYFPETATLNFGRAELTTVDNKPVARIVHKGTELVFLIIEENSINFKGDHFMQYVARQHIASGRSRSDNQTGRDIILIQVPSYGETLKEPLADPDKYSQLNRYPKYSKQWWKEYWLAIKKWPTLSTATFGIFSGLLQGASVAATKGVITGAQAAGVYFGINYFDALTFPSALETGITAFAYGSVFGLFASMFKNWERLPGSSFKRTLKNMSNSLIFSYLLSFVLTGGNPVVFAALYNPFTHIGLYNNLILLTAALLSNLSKGNWYSLATSREVAGISRGEFKPFGISTGWSQSNVEYQVAYLPSFVFRLLERIASVGSATRLNPTGVIIMLVQIPFSQFILYKYAMHIYKKTGHPGAKEIADNVKAQWHKTASFFTQKITYKGIMLYLKSKLGKTKGLISTPEGKPKQSFSLPPLSCHSLFAR